MAAEVGVECGLGGRLILPLASMSWGCRHCCEKVARERP